MVMTSIARMAATLSLGRVLTPGCLRSLAVLLLFLGAFVRDGFAQLGDVSGWSGERRWLPCVGFRASIPHCEWSE